MHYLTTAFNVVYDNTVGLLEEEPSIWQDQLDELEKVKLDISENADISYMMNAIEMYVHDGITRDEFSLESILEVYHESMKARTGVLIDKLKKSNTLEEDYKIIAELNAVVKRYSERVDSLDEERWSGNVDKFDQSELKDYQAMRTQFNRVIDDQEKQVERIMETKSFRMAKEKLENKQLVKRITGELKRISAEINKYNSILNKNEIKQEQFKKAEKVISERKSKAREKWDQGIQEIRSNKGIGFDLLIKAGNKNKGWGLFVFRVKLFFKGLLGLSPADKHPKFEVCRKNYEQFIKDGITIKCIIDKSLKNSHGESLMTQLIDTAMHDIDSVILEVTCKDGLSDFEYYELIKSLSLEHSQMINELMEDLADHCSVHKRLYSELDKYKGFVKNELEGLQSYKQNIKQSESFCLEIKADLEKEIKELQSKITAEPVVNRRRSVGGVLDKKVDARKILTSGGIKRRGG